MRDLYFVPNEELEPTDKNKLQLLDQEIKGILERTYQNRNFEFKRKPVQKRYCFELELPQNQVYIQVRYGFEFRALVNNLKGIHFKYVLGNSFTALELLIIEKTMKGPGWLKLRDVGESRRRMTKGVKWELEFRDTGAGYTKNLEVMTVPMIQ